MRYCTECGTAISTSVKFCGSCGAKVSETVTQPVSPERSILSTLESSDVTLREPPHLVVQRYAWLLVAALIGAIVVGAAIQERFGEDAGLVVGFGFGLLSVILTLADISANQATGPRRYALMVLLVAPLGVLVWLWARGRALRTTRGPFWVYAATMLLVVTGYVLNSQAARKTTPSSGATAAGLDHPTTDASVSSPVK